MEEVNIKDFWNYYKGYIIIVLLVTLFGIISIFLYDKLIKRPVYSTYKTVVFVKDTNGETEDDYLYFYTSDSFTKEGNRYVLLDPKIEYTTKYLRFLKDLNKFFCEDFSDSCEDLYYVFNTFEYQMIITKKSSDLVYGNGFDIEDDKYVLKDIVPSKWPDVSKYNEYVGTYTCMDQSISCDKLYRVTNYTLLSIAGGPTLESFQEDSLTGVAVKNTVKDITIKKTDTYDVQQYMNSSSDVWIEDESIVKIQDGKIVPLKKGKTTILIQNDEEVFLLHIDVQDVVANNIDNPKTSHNIFFLLFVMMGVLVAWMGRKRLYVK